MIFLIEYDRKGGSLVKMTSYTDDNMKEASAARLELELRLNRDHVDHEVVILEAASEQALHNTHQRYFDDFEAIGRSMIQTIDRMERNNCLD